MLERYSREKMSAIWSEESRLKTFLDVEIAVCAAHSTKGSIPPKSFELIKKHADFDIDRVKELDAELHHETIAFLTCVAEYIDAGQEKDEKQDTASGAAVKDKLLDKASRFLHLGMTSSDLLDTALSLQIKNSIEILYEDLDEILKVLKRRALEHKNTICMGRSHGVHAEPTTFGVKLLGYYDELKRSKKNLEDLEKELCVGMLSGAVGTYANVDPEIEKITCKNLGIEPAGISTQVISRDRHAKLLNTLATIAASIEKIAVEIRHLQRTEVLEVEEPFVSGQKGSSAMPHKRNPWRSENLTGLARLMRSYSQVGIENISLWHERDMSHSSTERIILPDAFTLLDFMLGRITWILDGLNVYPENMKRNMFRFGGVSFSQQLLLKLIDKGLKREDAYKLVQGLAHQAWNSYDAKGNELSFKELISSSADIKKHLNDKEIAEVFDPSYHLKNIDQIFKILD